MVNPSSQDLLPSRVVILGSGGFISKAVRYKLEAQNIPLLLLPRAELDLSLDGASDMLMHLLCKQDTLLFVAARAPVKSEEMLIYNLNMCQAVCKAIRSVPVKHLVYISSDAVYSDTDTPITETSAVQPDSLHGLMHLSREIMLKNAYSKKLCFLRPTLIYGDEDPHNGYGPNRFVRNVRLGSFITLFGQGEERRDHVYIEDVADIICQVIFKGTTGILNIATGNVYSFFDIAKILVDSSRQKISLKFVPRNGPIPHNGYRSFDIHAVQEAFPDFQFARLEDWLKSSCKIS